MYDRIYYIERIVLHSVVAKNHIVLYDKVIYSLHISFHTIRYGSLQPHCDVLYRYALCNKFYHTYLQYSGHLLCALNDATGFF